MMIVIEERAGRATFSVELREVAGWEWDRGVCVLTAVSCDAWVQLLIGDGDGDEKDEISSSRI